MTSITSMNFPSIGKRLRSLSDEHLFTGLEQLASAVTKAGNNFVQKYRTKANEKLTASLKGEHVDIAVVADKDIVANSPFSISAHVFDTDSNATVAGHQMTYVMCMRGNGKSKDTCVTREQTWNGSDASISFKFKAPAKAGQYSATLVVLQNGTQQKLALDRVDFTINVQKQPETLQTRLLSKVYKAIKQSLAFDEQQQVLATLLVKLQHGTTNEQLLAAAVIGEIAITHADLIMETDIYHSLSHLAIFGAKPTKAQALQALEKLAYGNAQYASMIAQALAVRTQMAVACALVYLQATGTGSMDGEQSQAVNEVAHQTGTSYRSNNAGDGPEKTRDHKYWFPRFKSNWLGSYRSKEMFVCCECALTDKTNKRYKPAEGKHCVCGQDAWKDAKLVEEREYGKRGDLSKLYGGIRYDEALARAKASGVVGTKRSAEEFYPPEKKIKIELGSVSSPSASSQYQQAPPSPLHINVHGSNMFAPASPTANSPVSVAQLVSTMTYYPTLSPVCIPMNKIRLEPPTDLDDTEIADILEVFSDKEDAEDIKKEEEFCNSFLSLDDETTVFTMDTFDEMVQSMFA